MEKKMKIGFYVSTGLLSALMLMSASMYVFNHEEIANKFLELGYPTYIIYPLALLKFLGVAVIWFGPAKVKEWAYTGFFFNFLLAFGAHLGIRDGEETGAIMAMVLLISSYFFYSKKTKQKVVLTAQ